MRILIVGSGIAGLTAALRLSGQHQVTLVTKARLKDSNTRFAQGGIAAAMSSDDSIAEHIQDTLRAGAGLNRLDAVEVLCAEGPDRIRDLIALGVAFDRRNGELARGLEAAHSRPRVLHAGGDATGLAVEMALVTAVRESGMEVLEHTFACDLVLERGASNRGNSTRRVTGLEALDGSGKLRTLSADTVLLASGGAGHLYPHTTNPSVATGDGVAIALRAGAFLSDVEFYQFHPTALATGNGFLISEAVRGEGAVLRDREGNRFMQAVHPDAELAPRDVVARGIAAQMARQHGQPVLLDATVLTAKYGPDFLSERFPTIDAACRRLGLDWSVEPIPVTPAAHYWMGGIRTDTFGRTSLPGLFAVGEVACTGVHGANRLASNSLLESLVFAERAARLLLEDSHAIDRWPQMEEGSRSTVDLDPQIDLDPLPVDRASLQALLWSAAGITRSESVLRDGQAKLRQWKCAGTTVADRETTNLLELGRCLVQSALARRESRGAHFREDFPSTSPRFAHQLTLQTLHPVREEVTC